MLTLKARIFAAVLLAVFVYFAPVIPGLESKGLQRLPYDPPFWVECNDLELVRRYPVCLAALMNRNSPILYWDRSGFQPGGAVCDRLGRLFRFPVYFQCLACADRLPPQSGEASTVAAQSDGQGSVVSDRRGPLQGPAGRAPAPAVAGHAREGVVHRPHYLWGDWYRARPPVACGRSVGSFSSGSVIARSCVVRCSSSRSKATSATT